MEYIIGILIVLIYFNHHIVGKDLAKKEIDNYLDKNNLVYLNHREILATPEVKLKFYNDANPFLFIFYGIKYYMVSTKNSDGKEIKVYIKWYKKRGLFNKSKVHFVKE